MKSFFTIVIALCWSFSSAQAEAGSTQTLEEAQAPSVFTNHLHSYMMVSPAQIYRIEGIETDFTFGFRWLDHNTSFPLGDREQTHAESTIDLTAVYSMPMGFNLGIDVSGVTSDTDTTFTGDVQEVYDIDVDSAEGRFAKYHDTITVRVSPLMSYWLNEMFALGLRVNYTIHNRDYAVEDLGVTDAAYHTDATSFGFVPAMLVTTKQMEAGVTYHTEEYGDEDTYFPATLVMHGRYALNSDLALGGMFEFKRYSGLSSQNIDQPVFHATAEWKWQQLRIEGGISRAAAYYDGVENISASNIATNAIRTAVDYHFVENANVGADFGYRFGSKIEDETEYRVADLNVAVRGNYLF